jgi:UDP-GlcNAc:undecaprenyl-phosphate GlcNAc-1-phosphate transferase
MSYLLTFIISLFLCLAIIPGVLRVARSRGWFDRAGARKIHTGQVPRLGGIGIALSFFATTVLVYVIFSPSGKLPSPGFRFWLLMLVGLGFNVLGLIDDFVELGGRLKLVFQVLLAVAVVALGFGFTVLELPFAPYRVELGVLGPILTVLWIVGICNAINLIDGMDGLAGGVAFIACATWAVLFYKDAQYLPAIAATAAGGAILGFLFFNFPPANIFMGDSGSLLLGFLIAVIPLLGSVAYERETGLLPAVTIALVPIFDTVSAVLRRWRLGVSLFTPDQFHIHHKLLNLGFSTRQSLVIVYGLCVFLGAAVLVATLIGARAGFALMIASWAIVGAFFLVMHYLKVKKVRLLNKSISEAAHYGEGPTE